MATNEKKATEKVTTKTVANAPVYTVNEYANAPKSLGVESPDIIRAAFKVAGKSEATIEDAKAIVNKFKNKEVK